jgi:hypothetical protein
MAGLALRCSRRAARARRTIGDRTRSEGFETFSKPRKPFASQRLAPGTARGAESQSAVDLNQLIDLTR